MAISTIVQRTAVDAITSVVITAVVQDPISHLYLREIRVFGQPDVNGDPVLQFTLSLSGATQAQVELTAPAAQF
jgi:hypothetical protein